MVFWLEKPKILPPSAAKSCLRGAVLNKFSALGGRFFGVVGGIPPPTHGRATVIFGPWWWVVKPKNHVRYYIRFDHMHGGIPPPSPPLAHVCPPPHGQLWYWVGIPVRKKQNKQHVVRRSKAKGEVFRRTIRTVHSKRKGTHKETSEKCMRHTVTYCT